MKPTTQTHMGIRRMLARLVVVALVAALLPQVMGPTVPAHAEDPIPGYMAQVDQTRLESLVGVMVTEFGPRNANVYQPSLGDTCEVNPGYGPYSKSTLDMASDYMGAYYEGLGYTVTEEVINGVGGNAGGWGELQGAWTGRNVIATKIGSEFPNEYIEVGAHLDTQPWTPGAGDNATGTAVVAEMARILKDYPTNYSIRFINYVGHEQGAYNEGSVYHLDQVLARGEKIKAGLIVDAVGWSGLGTNGVGTPLNGITPWINSDSDTIHIADVMVDIASTYSSQIGQFVVTPTVAGYSDNKSYTDRGLPAVGTVGGTPYQAPGYHMLGDLRGCADTLDKVDFVNVRKAAQVQIGALVVLDGEVPPPPIPGQLTVVAAVASSAEAPTDPGTHPPMRAFDGSASTYWNIAPDNFGYLDKWLQADLGATKSIDGIRLDFGSDPNRVATDFRIEVSDDPIFATHQDIASVTGNASANVEIPVDPAVTGRWVRLTITGTTGPDFHDYSLAEMRIEGSDTTPIDQRRVPVAATASSAYAPTGRIPSAAIDGRYDNFWHAANGATLPQWLQVDLETSRQVSRAVASFYGGFALTDNGSQAVDFQIWVGDDPDFTPGSYTLAADVTGSDSFVVQVPLVGSGGGPASGRYVRYVVTATKGTAFWNAILYEFELYGVDQPITLDQTITFGPLPDKTYGDAAFSVSAAATSGLPVSFSTSGNCTGSGLSPATITITAAGSCGVTASQAGDATYNPAPDVFRTFSIGPKLLTVTASSPADRVFGDAVPAVTPSYLGWVLGDDAGDLDTAPTCSTAYIQGDSPGDYATSCSGGVDVNYSFSYVAGNFHVGPKLLTVTASSKSKQYSDPLPLLTFTYSGFVLGDDAEDLDTAPTCSTTASQFSDPWTYPITCSGGVDVNYSFSYVEGTLTVTKEDARAVYTGPEGLVFTSSIKSGTVTIPLRATIQDITAFNSSLDAYPGDIRNATVQFVNRETGGTVLCEAAVGLILPGDSTVGTATCDWTVTISGDSEIFTVGIIVDGFYTRDASFDDAMITISKPISNFITGGGYLLMTSSSSGTYAGTPDAKMNFGFNVKYNKKLTNLQGHVNIIIRSDERVYQIKANAMTTLSVTPAKGTFPGLATFTSKANLTDITDPLAPVSLGGNLALTMELTDYGEPGSADEIAITLFNSGGELLFSSHWSGVRTVQQILAGGNLSVK